MGDSFRHACQKRLVKNGCQTASQQTRDHWRRNEPSDLEVSERVTTVSYGFARFIRLRPFRAASPVSYGFAKHSTSKRSFECELLTLVPAA